ncbi:hypothetical protein JB92DRAFT_2921992 [Gautieria morchelliformis]|nr:hypothetical protein JB92DRAFT_2921992 [Gautieria morchelliformis]
MPLNCPDCQRQNIRQSEHERNSAEAHATRYETEKQLQKRRWSQRSRSPHHRERLPLIVPRNPTLMSMSEGARVQTESAGSTGFVSGTESEHETWRKRKKPDIDPLSRPARHFGRTVEMWRRFEIIINEGLRDPSEADPADADLRAARQQYERLVDICPCLPEEIRTRGVKEVVVNMEYARARGRSEDVKRVKDLMQSLRAFRPALGADEKKSRGFNHPQIGRLLVSAQKVKQWDEDEEFRRRVKEGIETFRPQDYPVFLYENDEVDPDNLLSGFLRSEILVRAYRAVMLGPSAIDGRGIGTRIRNGRGTGTRSRNGNAYLNYMTDISIPSLSYIATVVHFGLSSQKAFYAGGGDLGRFDYQTFYHSVADLLGPERMAQPRKALLRWWKVKIFGCL